MDAVVVCLRISCGQVVFSICKEMKDLLFIIIVLFIACSLSAGLYFVAKILWILSVFFFEIIRSRW